MNLPEPRIASASNEAVQPTPNGTAPSEPGASASPATPPSPGPARPNRSRAVGRPAPEAIFLDLDDTLWPLEPSMRAAEQALRDWLAQHAPATGTLLESGRRAELRAQVLIDHPGRRHEMSFTREELLRRALVEAGNDEMLAPQAFSVFIAARRRVTPYPEVEAVLAQWSRRYAIVAVSNGNADVMQTPLGRFFAAAVNPENVGVAKPDSGIFLRACALAGVPPERALHIGDDPELDLIGARRAGLQGAWLLRPELAHRHPPDACGDWHPEPFPDLRAIDQLLGT
jgi:HAD superfamily hydrolase (TIGR01509 family)